MIDSQTEQSNLISQTHVCIVSKENKLIYSNSNNSMCII